MFTFEDKKTTPRAQDQGRYMWRRFELAIEDPAQISELETLLDKLRLTRRELALIVLGLRVRPGFSLQDFDT